MSTYNTGNPVGSVDVKDLFDNAQNLDRLVNDRTVTEYPDRLGNPRKSWWGMEQDFNVFLENSQFEYPPLAYIDGTPLTVDRPTQVVQRSGQLYRVRLPAAFPVNLTGTWATDEPLLNPMSDTALRQALANPAAVSEGAAMVARATQVVGSIVELRALLKTSPSRFATVLGYYAAGDGGGGSYYFDSLDTTSADNGGTVIVAADGGRWKMAHNGSVSIRQFGARGNWNGTTGADDTAAVLAALTCGVREVRAPAVAAGFAYRLTSPIALTTGVSLIGDGVSVYTAQNPGGTTPNTRGDGTWFHLDHAGIGFNCAKTTAFGSVNFRHFGTFRTHTIPGGATAFTPTVYDFDFVFSHCDEGSMHDICLLNPYRGIKNDNSRIWIDKVYGQPLAMGILTDDSYDVCRYTNVHFWCYWAMVQKVWDWTLANGSSFQMSRADGHVYQNCFSIFYNIGMRIVGNANGTANKLVLDNVFLDSGYHGLIVDGSAAGATIQMTNFLTQGNENAVGDNIGLTVYANQVSIDIANCDLRQVNSYCMLIAGQFCQIGISNLYLADWAWSGGGATPINVSDTTSNLRITGQKRFFKTGYSGGYYSGSGVIRTELAQGRSTVSTNASGDIIITIAGNATPNMVNITMNSNSPLHWAIISKAQGTFTVRFFNAAGAALTSTSLDFNYECLL